MILFGGLPLVVGLCLLTGRNFARLSIDVKLNSEIELVSLAAAFRVIRKSEKCCLTTRITAAKLKLNTKADSICTKLFISMLSCHLY